MILFVLMTCAFAVATAEFVLVGLLPELSTDLGVSIPVAGQLVTGYQIAVAVGGPPAILLLRRAPRRPLLAGAMAVALAAALLSSVATSYGVLMTARVGSAVAQALFVAVASEVAMSVVPAERSTAAVARVFGGFALATVLGLPLGTLIGDAYGWHASFLAVAVLCAVGLAGILVYCPAVTPAAGSLRAVTGLLSRPLLIGLLITVLTFTGFVAVFTYAAPMLQDLAGLSPGWTSLALVGYGVGTVLGNVLAGRVRPGAITRVLPFVLAALAVLAVGQAWSMRQPVTAVLGLALLGAAAFVAAPTLQTFLLGQAPAGLAGVVAAINLSAFGLAAALGAGLGGAVIAGGWGLAGVGPAAGAVLTVGLVAALALRATAPSSGADESSSGAGDRAASPTPGALG